MYNRPDRKRSGRACQLLTVMSSWDWTGAKEEGLSLQHKAGSDLTFLQLASIMVTIRKKKRIKIFKNMYYPWLSWYLPGFAVNLTIFPYNYEIDW